MYRQLHSDPNAKVSPNEVRAVLDQEIEAARVAYENSRKEIKKNDPALEQKYRHALELEYTYNTLRARKIDFESEYGTDAR